MSLVFGTAHETFVALGADSDKRKIILVPQLHAGICWVGDFNKSPEWILCDSEREYLKVENPATTAHLRDAAEVLLRHLNTLDHVHPNGRQAAIFIAGFSDRKPDIACLQSNGNKGSWKMTPDTPQNFMAGCLEPFGIRELCAPIDPVNTPDEFADLAANKIKVAELWLKNNGRNPIIVPPLNSFHATLGNNWTHLTRY